MQIKHAVTLSTNQPVDAQLWMTSARDLPIHKIDYSHSPGQVQTSSDGTINYHELSLQPGHTAVEQRFNIYESPPPPELQSVQRYLQTNDPLMQITPAITSAAIKLMGRTKQETVDNISKFLVERLHYHTNPLSRIANDVLQSKLSDCGGYHALFCALLRAVQIPAVPDFGYRLSSNNQPHVWAWWFDDNQWQMIDLNDRQKGIYHFTPRVSMYLNTAPTLLPDYPGAVRPPFIQSSWMWIKDRDALRAKGLREIRSSSLEVES